MRSVPSSGQFVNCQECVCCSVLQLSFFKHPGNARLQADRNIMDIDKWADVLRKQEACVWVRVTSCFSHRPSATDIPVPVNSKRLEQKAHRTQYTHKSHRKQVGQLEIDGERYKEPLMSIKGMQTYSSTTESHMPLTCCKFRCRWGSWRLMVRDPRSL